MTYLDWNATTPVDPRVIEAMCKVYSELPGNAGSRTHLHGEACRSAVEDARRKVAALAGVEPAEVVFTSGATESDNIALLGAMDRATCSGKRHMVTTAIEHKAVLGPAKKLEESGCKVDYCPVGESGAVDVDRLLSLVRDDTVLVSVMQVNNETGVVQPVVEIGRRLREEHPDVLFHVDAAQGFGKIPGADLGLYDLMSVSAHKMGGPQGVGALIVRRKGYRFPPLTPPYVGGGQEKGIRPGTVPVALVVGFGVASGICLEEWEKDRAHAEAIKGELLRALSASDLRYSLNGDQGLCVPTTLNVSFDGVSSEALMISSRGDVSVSNGSACTSSSYSPSYVLIAMGLGEERAKSAIRLSWGRSTCRREASEAFCSLLESVGRLQNGHR